jgi:hypothetical protein
MGARLAVSPDFWGYAVTKSHCVCGFGRYKIFRKTLELRKLFTSLMPDREKFPQHITSLTIEISVQSLPELVWSDP